MVRKSARIWVGWNSLVRPLNTGTPAYRASSSTISLAEAPVLDAVKHPAQDPGRIGDGLLLADLRARGVQVGDAHAQVMARDLEGAAGPGGGLLKNQGDILALENLMGDTRLFLGLELGGYVQEVLDFGGGEVQ